MRKQHFIDTLARRDDEVIIYTQGRANIPVAYEEGTGLYRAIDVNKSNVAGSLCYSHFSTVSEEALNSDHWAVVSMEAVKLSLVDHTEALLADSSTCPKCKAGRLELEYESYSTVNGGECYYTCGECKAEFVATLPQAVRVMEVLK